MKFRLKYSITFLLVWLSLSAQANTSEITAIAEPNDREQILPSYAITIQGIYETFNFQFSGKIFSNASALFFYFSPYNKETIYRILLKLDFFADFKSIFSILWYLFHSFV